MFRKIHSNRDPEATVWRELRKEFPAWEKSIRNSSEQVVRRYQWPAFSLMVVLLLGSVLLSFVLFHHPADQPGKAKKSVETIGDGFGRLLSTTSAIRQAISLKRQADSLLKLRTLSHADSLQLDSVLGRLYQVQQSLKP